MADPHHAPRNRLGLRLRLGLKIGLREAVVLVDRLDRDGGRYSAHASRPHGHAREPSLFFSGLSDGAGDALSRAWRCSVGIRLLGRRRRLGPVLAPIFPRIDGGDARRCARFCVCRWSDIRFAFRLNCRCAGSWSPQGAVLNIGGSRGRCLRLWCRNRLVVRGRGGSNRRVGWLSGRQARLIIRLSDSRTSIECRSGARCRYRRQSD